MSKKYWIVWNEGRTEGFITDDERDALDAAGRAVVHGATSTLGDAFKDAYVGEPYPHNQAEVQEVEL